MTKERYWVVGGDYAGTGFSSLKDGRPAQAIGPFEDRARAEQARGEGQRDTRSASTGRCASTAEQCRWTGGRRPGQV